MIDDPNFGREWIDCKKALPILGRMYWITDGKDVALAEWNIETMQWRFRYQYSMFNPVAMLPVKLPPIPEQWRKKNDKAA